VPTLRQTQRLKAASVRLPYGTSETRALPDLPDAVRRILESAAAEVSISGTSEALTTI
jgi:hypothetical protein